MNSDLIINSAALFTASLTSTDVVNVVPHHLRAWPGGFGDGRLPPKRPRKVGRGGKFPKIRHEHLLGLFGRSHSPAQVQEDEREERRLSD